MEALLSTGCAPHLWKREEFIRDRRSSGANQGSNHPHTLIRVGMARPNELICDARVTPFTSRSPARNPGHPTDLSTLSCCSVDLSPGHHLALWITLWTVDEDLRAAVEAARQPIGGRREVTVGGTGARGPYVTQSDTRRGYEPRKRTCGHVRFSPISASLTRRSEMWPSASTAKQ